MRKQLNPAVAVVAVVVVIVILGLMGMKVMQNASDAPKQIVLPAKPDDPTAKEHTNPNLSNSGT